MITLPDVLVNIDLSANQYLNKSCITFKQFWLLDRQHHTHIRRKGTEYSLLNLPHSKCRNACQQFTVNTPKSASQATKIQLAIWQIKELYIHVVSVSLSDIRIRMRQGTREKWQKTGSMVGKTSREYFDVNFVFFSRFFERLNHMLLFVLWFG